MPNRTIKTEQDCKDFLSGLKLLGTGGGGAPKTGMELLTKALAEGLNMSWVDVSELPEDVYSCTAFASGSISEGRPEDDAGITEFGKQYGLTNQFGLRAPEVAVRELEKYSGVKIGAIVPVELGASNTPAPLVTAARMGLALVDGDYSGRAVPQEMQTTYFLNDLSITPAAIVNYWGDIVIMKQGSSPAMIERIGKYMALGSYGAVYFASVLLSAKQTRETVVPGTLTLSLELGQAIHQATAAGNDPVKAALKILDGWHLFTGTVISKDWEDVDGAMTGTTRIQGSGAFEGHTMDIWFLNENHIAWLDGQPYVFSPDLLIQAHPETCEGYTNTELKAGDPVVILGTKVNQAFRTEKAIRHFGPRFWNFDFDYVPIEEVMAKSA